MTTQRTVILEYLGSVKTHPTAAQVYEAVKGRLPGISLATVYRTLTWLRDQGQALELTYGVRSSRYDGDVAEHAHLSCNNCGQVIDVKTITPKLDRRRVRQETGAIVHKVRLEMQGLCSGCAADNKEADSEYN